MSNYLVIDSNTKYAEELFGKLCNTSTTNDIIDTTSYLTVSDVCDALYTLIGNDNNKVILINAESRLNDKCLQHQAVLELIFWLRCKHNCVNPIVIYSCVSVTYSLKQNPENFILVAPGSYYIKLPINEDNIAFIQQLSPLKNIEDLKPYLKPKVDAVLVNVRHRYANYAGMAMMMLVAKDDFSLGAVTDMLPITHNYNYANLINFVESVDHFLLKAYFDFNYKNSISGKFKSFATSNKKILLIDDLAKEGWQPILSQIIYGNPTDDRIQSVDAFTETDIEDAIYKHKPHLILLDLRLNDEEGKKKPTELGGYKILQFLKRSPLLRGVPVIMFTASSNAQTVKLLISSGAYCVWTKPGIDEGLSLSAILKRYEQLLKLVNEIFSPDSSLSQKINDIYDASITKAQIEAFNFDEIRNQILNNLDFIKYRLLLSKDNLLLNTPEPYKSVDAIYIDANTLITGEKTMLFHEIIASVFKLSILTHLAEFSYLDSHRNLKTTRQPKVVIMNCIFDEVIKIAKVNFLEEVTKYKAFHKWDLRFFRALIAQLVVKELLQQKFARTEFKPDLHSKKGPIWSPTNPKENVHADGYILDEISSLTVTNQSFTSFYPKNLKIVFVTGDSRLKEKIQKFNIANNLTVVCRECLIHDMRNIDL